jgi:hypothetical protein
MGLGFSVAKGEKESGLAIKKMIGCRYGWAIAHWILWNHLSYHRSGERPAMENHYHLILETPGEIFGEG